jgi:oxygen-dependent protoporphyrinogen oxidase
MSMSGNGQGQPADTPRVAVVGAGVSGLTVAFELLDRAERRPGGIEVLCLESGDRPGGNIRTFSRDGFTCEWGPNGFLDNSPPTLTLVRRLGLGQRMTRASDTSGRRFIFRDGKLRLVPTDPPSFLRSDILPLGGRLRVLTEPLRRGKRDDGDESVFEFASRRIGRRAATILVDAMVTGIYAGDVRKLSLPATFPIMREMEAKHGTLFRAMLARRKAAKERGETSGGPAGPGGALTSFRGGMQELIDGLAARVEKSLRFNERIAAVTDMGRRGFRILRDVGAPLDVDAVVLACPAWRAAGLVRDADPAMAAAMDGIGSAPLAVVHFGYRAGAFGEDPVGFGFLVPRSEGVRTLGTIWSSNVFEGRAPEGSMLMTSMVGGALDHEAHELDEKELVDIVKQDLNRIMDIVAAPYFVEVYRHPRGIPQYELGHLDRVAAIEARAAEHPGLFVCGNSYRGISVNKCVEEAPEIAESVLTHLNSRGRGT